MITVRGRPKPVMTDLDFYDGRFYMRFDSEQDLGFWLECTFSIEELMERLKNPRVETVPSDTTEKPSDTV